MSVEIIGLRLGFLILNKPCIWALVWGKICKLIQREEHFRRLLFMLSIQIWSLIVLWKLNNHKRKIHFTENKNCFNNLFSLFLLAHPSRRLEWAIAVRFRPSCVVRRPSSVNFLHFHLLLENACLDFNQTWQESSLGVGDSKLFK